jgi:hypothetical protein
MCVPIQISTELFDIDENAFEPYPQSFSSATQTLVLQDPFYGSSLSTIAESVPQHLQNSYSEMFNVSTAKSPHTVCSVCGCAGDRMAVLVPCKHLLCSACMTSALNIVGEKDIHCAVCARRSSTISNCKLSRTTTLQHPPLTRGAFLWFQILHPHRCNNDRFEANLHCYRAHLIPSRCHP